MSRGDRESESRSGALLWALLPYAVFLLLAAISWGRWIEPYVDSGRELMVPLRLARGERLYRDVRFYHGPLAPYLAAGLEKVCARSLTARIALAGAIALLHLEALRRLGRLWMTSARTALAVSAVMAAVFFARPGGELFPFSLDTALAVAAIAWALHFSANHPQPRRAWAAGGCVFAALLARPELGLVTAAALCLDIDRGRHLVKRVLFPVIAASAVYAVVSAGTPLETLRKEGWLALVAPPEAFRKVYTSYAGLDRPAFRIAELGLAASVVLLGALLLAVAASASRRTGTRNPVGLAIETGAFLLLAAAAWLSWRPYPSLAPTLALVPPLIRVVPILAVTAALGRLASRLRRGDPKPQVLSLVPDAVLFVSAVFASRVLLTAGYGGPYGSFLLPLPFLVVITGLFSLADRLASPVGAVLPRLAAGVLALFVAFRLAVLWDENRRGAWSRVETPAGSLYLAEPVARTTQQTLLALSRHLPPEGTLVGFPEGGFFNYVLDRRNPLPQEQFFPGHLDARVEQETIRRLSERPPDAVVLANVLAVGHGSLAFGRDYLVELGRFLDERFAAAASFGPGSGPNARIGDPQFFVTIRVPRPSAPLPPSR